MRRAFRNSLAAAAVAALTIAPVARAQTLGPSGQKVVLRVGTTVDLTTANPFGVNAGSDWLVVTAQYDMLLKFADEDLSAAPSLATGCDHSSDYTIWTCTLRDGLTWSDGTPLTSEDVAFSYRFVIDHRIPQYREYFPFDPVFSTPDEHTLVWTATKPTFALTMPPWVYIVPEHVWSQYDGADLRTIKSVRNVPSVASGPFTLSAWTPGQFWTMDRNPHYWGEQPAVDQIQFQVFTNQEAMVEALKNGEIDIADGVQPSLYQTVQGAPNVTTQRVASDWWLNLAFNFGGQGSEADPLPALHDLTLRTAIEMAIDKQKLADTVYQGVGTPGDTVIRPLSAYWHLDIPADQEVTYDPEGAIQMLESAGYKDSNGDGIREDPKTGDPLVLRMPASRDTTGAVEAGQLIVGFLEKIGLQVKLMPVSDGKMGDYWGAGNFDAYIWYWSGDPDPNYQLSIFTSDQCGDWSDGCWKDPHYDALYQQQQGIMDPTARLQVVQEAQQYIYDQIPVVVLAYPGWLQAYRTDRFTGWVPTPTDHGYLLPSYNYDSLVKIRPVTGSAATPAAAGLTGWIWGAAAAVVALAGGALVVRGRRRRPEEA